MYPSHNNSPNSYSDILPYTLSVSVSLEFFMVPCTCHGAAAAAAKSLQSCPTLCDLIDGSPPGSPVPEILQARTLEWVAISFSNAWKWKVKVKSLSRVRPSATPWTACSLPGSSVHGIFQARVLEWGAIAFSVHMPYPFQTRLLWLFCYLPRMHLLFYFIWLDLWNPFRMLCSICIRFLVFYYGIIPSSVFPQFFVYNLIVTIILIIIASKY